MRTIYGRRIAIGAAASDVLGAHCEMTVLGRREAPPSTNPQPPESFAAAAENTSEHRYTHFKSCFEIGSDRIRLPVAAKIALHSAGGAGGSAGSPSPVGGK